MSALDDLRTYLRARDDREGAVAPALRSQVHPGAQAGDVYVLIHGLTASPPAWRAIAEALAARGATIVVPRLPLHGHADRLTRALAGLTDGVMTADMEELLHVVGALPGRLIVVGHSLGGTMAMHVAARMSRIDRVIGVAPFLGITYLPHETHHVVVPLLRRLPNLFVWWDPVLRERQQPDHGYPRYPLHALAAGIAVAEAVYDDAHRPPSARTIDFVLNGRENSVSNRAAVRLAHRWRAAGASVAVHELRGLPASHDIVEPLKPHAARAFDALVAIIAGEHSPDDRIHAL